MFDFTKDEIPPGQQLVAADKWPIIGEKLPANSDEPWRLSVSGLVDQELSCSLEELMQRKQTSIEIDIHCVTRWSRQKVRFAGVLLSELLETAGVQPEAKFISFVARSSRNHSTSLQLETALGLNTLVALTVNGEPLSIEHGGPIRSVVPERYFYKSLKWLDRMELLAFDRLGFWEAETGYHNGADPWKEERYMAPSIDRRTAIKLIESKDFSGHDLRSIDASHRELSGLKADNALLRDANFRNSNLQNAIFRSANLSNAHFEKADLRKAVFVETDLEGANLSGADLRETEFKDCSFIGASFFDNSVGLTSGAIFDNATQLDEELLKPLTKAQREFVRIAKKS